jgi:hypothetical protein
MAVWVGARLGILYIPLSEMIRLPLRPTAVNTTNESSDDIFGRDRRRPHQPIHHRRQQNQRSQTSDLPCINIFGKCGYRTIRIICSICFRATCKWRQQRQKHCVHETSVVKLSPSVSPRNVCDDSTRSLSPYTQLRTGFVPTEFRSALKTHCFKSAVQFRETANGRSCVPGALAIKRKR